MSPEERSDIVQLLEESRRDFIAAAGGVPEAQAGANPAEGRWSVVQCVEHVTIVEGRFRGFLETAGRVEQPALDAPKEAALLTRVTDRSARAQAPEPVQPSGRFGSLAQALDQFNAERTRTVAFAQARAADLISLASQHPRFGPLNGRELLVIIAGHARRHAAQIREIRAALGVS